MRKICITIVSCICLLSFLNKLHAQSYKNFSKYEGGIHTDAAVKMQVVNGETYTTRYSSYQSYEFIVTKYNSNGVIVYSTNLGSNHFYGNGMKVLNGEVFLIGDGFFSITVAKLNVDGSIAFVRNLHGTGQMYPVDNYEDIQILNNEIYVAGTHEGNSYPVTMGPVPQNWGIYGFLTKISAIDGSIIMSMFTGGSSYNFASTMNVQDGAVYLTGTSSAIDLPITIGNYPNDAYSHIYVRKLNCSNFNTVYCRYVGETSSANIGASKVINGEVHLTGQCSSANFPVTNGSTASTTGNDVADGFYTRLNIDGSIGFSSYLSTDENDNFDWIDLSNDEVFLSGVATDPLNNQHIKLVIFKLNVNGSIGYTKKIDLVTSGYYYYYSSRPSYKVLNGELYISGMGATPDLPVTNGTIYTDSTGFFTHYGSSGNLIFSTFLGKMSSLLPMQFVNNKFYLLGSTNSNDNYPVTDNSAIAGNYDNVLIILKPGGTNIFRGYIGGNDDDKPADMAIDNGDVYFIGNTSSANFPVTSNTLYQGSQDVFLTKLSFCPNSYYLANDSLSPKTQTVCQYGLAQIINGNEMMVPGDSLPTIYLNGIATLQAPVKTKKYQWQIAYSITGPWSDIPGAVFKDYRPIVGAVDQYYRRASFTPSECGSSFIHFSDTASALVNIHTAPTVNAGGPFVTCPASAITIGGTPTATGGTPPYSSFAWDMGAAAVANPTVSPNYNTIYTLVVTDALGCSQISQATVLVYKADAGADKSNCAGAAVKIGSSPISGVPGLIYIWQPATALTSTTIAQPFANPIVQTDYSLTLTVPKSGGGTCITKDTVRVTPVHAPVTPNFAGYDKVICLADSVSIGTSPEAGFNYTWSPADNLINNNLSVATYYGGAINMPVPNPATFTLTAHKAGCYFTDNVVVATIESRAGIDGCGPRIVGLPDRTPNINETYSWVKISGPGNLTGATNLPQVPVSASTGVATIYGLTVSYNGGSCYDEVTVPPSCGDTGVNGCMTQIIVDAKYHCPGYSANDGAVTLIASSNVGNAVFSWAPQAGLSAYTGATVQLTDNIQRTYTVTARDIYDSSNYCIGHISTNDPVYVRPVFDAPDTATCANTTVMIGLPPVTGYNYLWTGYNLSDNTISSPVATISTYSAQYMVHVTNGTGCELNDTVIVTVQNTPVNAGADWMICSNATVQLGTPTQFNSTYLWQPQAAPWQNGTNEFSAQPEVLVASSVTYTVTATSSAGCVSTDQVTITVNNSPIIPDAPDKTICLHYLGTTIGSPALSGAVYQWVPATGLNNPGIAQPTANPTSTTTYTVFVTFPGLCSLPATDQVTVTVNDPSPAASEIHFCPSNGAVALGAAVPTNLTSYQWYPYQLVTNAYIPNPSTLTPPPNNSTTFVLIGYNSQGCQYRDSITIVPTVNTPIAGNDRTICKDQPTAIGSSANITGTSISYNWTPVTYLDNPASPNPVFTGSMVGTFQYILTKTDNSFSCTSVDTVNIYVEDIMPPLNSPTVCKNGCVQIGTTPVAGLQYQWSPTAGLSDPGSSNPLACVGAVSANYTLTVIDPTGCTSSAGIVIAVNDLTGFQVGIPALNVCLGDTGVSFQPSLALESGSTYSYLWSPNNGSLSDVNIADPTVFITGTGSSQYFLQITDNTTGCTNTAVANLVVNNCPPLATAGNFMWFDTNTNGIQDVGEIGVSGIAVKLYNNVGFNIGTAVTDAYGSYNFNNIPIANDYYVIFNKPAGYSFTAQNVGGVTAINNSKVDMNGRSNNFNLTIGADISNIDAGIKSSGTVPVSLLDFTATLHNRKVFLNWQTTAEYNNDHFDVERSNDAIHFTIIGSVSGNGTTSLPHNYSLIDPHPLTGINYYRLRQVDIDGHANYSQVVKIQLNDDDIVSVFYNNGNNSIQLAFNKKQDNVRLKLFGANGQLIRSATTANNITAYTFELPPLATGVYMLQLINKNLAYTKKIFIDAGN